MRIYTVICALLMGLGFVSCNDPGGQIRGGTFIMKVTNIDPYTFTYADGKVKYIAENPAALANAALSADDMVMIAWYFDTSEQQLGAGVESVKVTVTAVMKLTAQTLVANDKGPMHENSTVNKIGVLANTFVEGVSFFGKETLVVPIFFLAEMDVMKHTFVLVYDKSGVKADDTELKLYLRHRSMEDQSTKQVNVYKTFNIVEVLKEFKTTTGKDPLKITVYANETSKINSNALADAKEELTDYSIDYKFDE